MAPPSEPCPRLTVVVATFLGCDRIGTCLGSLVGQTLLPLEFEIVVVQNGPACATPEVVARVRREHPRHQIRLLETSSPGIGRARNVGIDAARGAQITFVDDDDWVSPGYLAALLASARPGVVPVAYIADVPENGRPGVRGDFDNYFSRRLLPLSGRTVPADAASVAFSPNAAKLLPTAIARQVRYAEDVPSGEDFLFWIAAYAREPFELHITERSAGAVYYRTLRSDSVSRQELSYDFNVSQRLDCIRRLNEHLEPGPILSKLIRWLGEGQTTAIRGYLDVHPEADVRIRRDIRARGMSDVIPWKVINRGTAGDLAILFLFTPYLDTSALVAARRIRARGVITDVISQDLDEIRDKDGSSQKVASEFLDETVVIPGAANFEHWHVIRSFAERTLVHVDRLQNQKGQYLSLYSRAMAPPSHFAAAIVKLRNPGIVWTAEFSDPMMINAYGEERVGDVEDDWLTDELRAGIQAAGFEEPATRRMFAWTELIAYALADKILFTNEHQQRYMIGYCRDRALAQRAEAISSFEHHPTLPERFYHATPVHYPLVEGVVHVAYFGVFYQSRGLTEVVDALEKLSGGERQRIRLHVFTNKPHQLEIESLQRDLTDVITVRPYFPFLQFLNLTLKFDALIVNDYATADHRDLNPYLPSKISDYRGSGTPVWSIVEPGSVLSSMDTDFTSTLGDPVGALRVLRELLAVGPRPNRPQD